MSKISHGSVLALMCLGGALAGCQDGEPAKTAAVVPPFSINELMVMIVDRPGELLWDAEKEDRAPKTAEDWGLLANHAVELAAAATLIRLGGTGPKDMAWVKEPRWQATSQQLVDAALQARQAAEDKNLDTLVAANGAIVEACEACHKEFKPDIPTGGLFMRQRPSSAPAEK
jgi:cytochrome c556